MAGGRAIGTARAVLGLRHNLGRALALRDLHAFLRLQCLGVLARTGLAEALGTPGTAAELAARTGLADVELTTALLDLGVACRQVRRRGSTYRARGARLRAVASGRAPDVTGLAEEVTAYSSPIYAALEHHLRGAAPEPYDAGLGDVIARVSRAVDPVVGPWLISAARAAAPARVLDVGCGSGVNLRWLAAAAPSATIVGVEVAPEAAASARENLASWRLDRVEVVEADVDALPATVTGEPWDLVLLAQNIYYWSVDARAPLLARLRALTGGRGTVLALTAVPARSAIGRHLDLVLRVTTGCARLPTREELAADARAAGFSAVSVRDLAPGAGMVALVASG